MPAERVVLIHVKNLERETVYFSAGDMNCPIR